MSEPSLIDRARLALQVFSRGLPRLRDYEHKQAKTPFMWPAWRTQTPTWAITSFENYVTEGYNLNSLIYSAVMYKARAMIAAPLRAYRGDPEQPEALPVDHPLSKLCARPNKFQSWAEFQMLNEVYLNLAGEVFVMCLRPRGGGLPEGLVSLRPDRVYLIPKDDEILGWLYVPEGKFVQDGLPILSQDMMTIKFPNPSDPFEGLGRGLSPLLPLAQSADVDNQVTAYLKTFFEHSAVPQGILKFNVPLDPGEMARIRERWTEIYGGVENWAEIGVLDQTGEYQQLGMNFSEMGFESIDERNESRILGPFGVPPILIGTRMGLARSTFSNYEIARRACWEDTLVPEIKLYEDEYSYFLQSNDGGFVRFDLGQVPALQQDKAALVAAALQMWQMGVPSNQAFHFMGLNVEPVEGGDVGYLPLGVTAVGAPKPEPLLPGIALAPEITPPATDTNAGATEAEEQGAEPVKAFDPAFELKGLTPGQKAHFWHQVDGTARRWEPRFEELAGECLEHDRRALQAELSAGKKKVSD
jgi:HK97 family phage portal protein